MDKILSAVFGVAIEEINPSFVEFAKERMAELSDLQQVDPAAMVPLWVSLWKQSNPGVPVLGWQEFESRTKEENLAYQKQSRVEGAKRRIEELGRKAAQALSEYTEEASRLEDTRAAAVRLSEDATAAAEARKAAYEKAAAEIAAEVTNWQIVIDSGGEIEL